MYAPGGNLCIAFRILQTSIIFISAVYKIKPLINKSTGLLWGGYSQITHLC